MALKEDFEAASQNVQKLKSRPSNEQLLALYSLYKQATEGDVTGSRPGMLDIKGRKKYDAWTERRGLGKDAAMKQYVELVKNLQQELGQG